ncbi:hypothetical protein MalM25_31160 [Planctomycetes bacterium MalM25]|nr:hypothetical protein MalM25_31160 [Planctomycetes bacterium MalM25]
MTTTDRAFIAAIQQASAGAAPTAPRLTPDAPEPTVAAPHFTTTITTDEATAVAPSSDPVAAPPTTGKAPLSEHLARRREQAAAMKVAPRDRPLRPGVEVESFDWPELAVELEHTARRPLLDLIARATRRGVSAETPALALLAARPDVGASTTLLATARLIAGLGGKVAILDTSPLGAASMLGVRRVAHLDGRIDPLGIDDLLIASRDGGVSVLSTCHNDEGSLFGAALERLTDTHDLVLIDAGDTGSVAPAILGEPFAGVALLLIDSADHDPVTRRQTVTVLAEAGVSVAGIVETQAESEA